MPLVAGYTRAESYIQYNKDPKTFRNSEITMDYLFAESLQLFKMAFWSFFNLLDEDVDITSIQEEQNNSGINLNSDDNLYFEIFIGVLLLTVFTIIIALIIWLVIWLMTPA